MASTKSTRAKLTHLRRTMFYALQGQLCSWCSKPLVESDTPNADELHNITFDHISSYSHLPKYQFLDNGKPHDGIPGGRFMHRTCHKVMTNEITNKKIIRELITHPELGAGSYVLKKI